MPELEHLASGKVREIYSLDDDTLLLVDMSGSVVGSGAVNDLIEAAGALSGAASARPHHSVRRTMNGVSTIRSSAGSRRSWRASMRPLARSPTIRSRRDRSDIMRP